MKNVVFWDVMPCGPCKTEVSEERIASIVWVIRITEVETLAVTETSVLTRATRNHIAEGAIQRNQGNMQVV
jgi:hypothetical protein